jgi:hypothetical protein
MALAFWSTQMTVNCSFVGLTDEGNRVHVYASLDLDSLVTMTVVQSTNGEILIQDYEEKTLDLSNLEKRVGKHYDYYIIDDQVEHKPVKNKGPVGKKDWIKR